ncbi:outer membrane lipoprotein-sorting protein [Effusibacillus dendaii]|uniref:Lipoprotein n=1 Tax=Effusibacillus dendaii TaxID=2743772 RepID=A0A7I8DAK5_9BACL|nr:DUF4367 domain-containing protein [Effusibacillus dendaii]BCJ87218.1 lipoprotein [Effusibacillus dendaii]
MRKSLRVVWVMVFAICVGLAGCGIRSADDVVKNLQSVQKNLKSYKSTATMTVQTPSSTSKYYIETWYQAPGNYRIALGNEKKEISQVILRNEDGIYVVNPQLKKSYRFRGDWSENQGGHVYLYHALVDRILQAKDKELSIRKDSVLINMSMLPENPIITKQQVLLDDRKLYPKQMVLFNKENQPIVTVDYESFDTGMNFQKDAFTPEAAMALANTDGTVAVAGGKSDFGVIEPAYLPKGMTLKDVKEQDQTIYLVYTDAQGNVATITEARAEPGAVALPSGKMQDLLGTPAIVTGSGNVKTLYWTHQNLEFSLTSSLPVQEMTKMAQSTMSAIGK